MSALAGVWNFTGKPGSDGACARIMAAQAMYGPHDSAQWDAGEISLGRRLFRLLPEDQYDWQPSVGGEGRFTLVADLRLDNRDELAAALRIAPDRARTMADSAVLLGAWEAWGENCVDRLVGDYAFAIWDSKERKLSLARDPLGMRPLHFHRAASFFAFASMPKGLHALPEIPRAPDEDRIAEFLVLMPEKGTQSFFRNVERVEPGHMTTVTKAGVLHRRHWEPQRKPLRLSSAEDYAEGMRHHFEAAVRATLRGTNGTVATHLSSGFDSSTVTATAARLLDGTGKVVAYTSVPREGFDGAAPRAREGNEGTIAAITAARYPNVEHVLVHNNRTSPLANLDRLFVLFDRPILNPCNHVWVSAINDAIRSRNIGVLLTGQMGNMSISYGGETLLPQLIRSGRWLRWAREASGLARNRHMRWIGVLGQSFGPFVPSTLWRWANRYLMNRGVDVGTYSGVNPSRLKELDLASRASGRALDLNYRPRRDGFETRLWVMRRVDIGNMRHGTLAGWGIDQRDPTTDRRLIEFCLNIPEEQLLSNGNNKAVARIAFADRLPQAVLDSRHKGYQAADWHEGLATARAELRDEVERLGAIAPAATAIDLPRLGKLIEDWPAGGWETSDVISQYRLKLLRGIAVGHFLRRASGSNL